MYPKPSLHNLKMRRGSLVRTSLSRISDRVCLASFEAGRSVETSIYRNIVSLRSLAFHDGQPKLSLGARSTLSSKQNSVSHCHSLKVCHSERSEEPWFCRQRHTPRSLVSLGMTAVRMTRRNDDVRLRDTGPVAQVARAHP